MYEQFLQSTQFAYVYDDLYHYNNGAIYVYCSSNHMMLPEAICIYLE